VTAKTITININNSSCIDVMEIMNKSNIDFRRIFKTISIIVPRKYYFPNSVMTGK